MSMCAVSPASLARAGLSSHRLHRPTGTARTARCVPPSIPWPRDCCAPGSARLARCTIRITAVMTRQCAPSLRLTRDSARRSMEADHEAGACTSGVGWNASALRNEAIERAAMIINPEKYRKTQYLKAADLANLRTKVRIHSVTEEEVGTPAETKLVMQFTTATLKPMVLNFTNVDALVKHFGPDGTKWTNRVVVLLKTTAVFQGRVVDAIRLEFPPEPAAEVAPPAAPAAATISASAPAGSDEADLA